MIRVFFVFVGLLVASVAGAQTPQAAPGNGLQWDQGAGSLAQANGYLYRLTDGPAAPQPIIVTCTGATAPFVCTTELNTTQAPGLHTVTVTAATTLVDGTVLESAPSAGFTYEWVIRPNSPTNIRLRPRPTGLTLPPVQ